jgi:hypothetical protein
VTGQGQAIREALTDHVPPARRKTVLDALDELVTLTEGNQQERIDSQRAYELAIRCADEADARVGELEAFLRDLQSQCERLPEDIWPAFAHLHESIVRALSAAQENETP